MDLVKVDYSTTRNCNGVRVFAEDVKRVVDRLNRYYVAFSTPTGLGRTYSVGGGTIEHRIGPQPNLTFFSDSPKELKAMGMRFRLPL